MSKRSAVWRGVLGLLLVVLMAIILGSPGDTPALAQPPACNYSETVLADNPIAYWRLGEASGTTAVNLGSLGSAVDGTYQGGVTLGTTGLVESDTDTAAGIDGSDDVVFFPAHPDINTGGPYAARTIELWFQASSLSGTQMLYKEGGYLNGFNIFLEGDQLYVGAFADGVGQQWVSTPVLVDTAYHVALVFDGSAQTVTGYLNGAGFGTTPPIADAIPYHEGGTSVGAVYYEGTLYPSGPVTYDLGDHLDGIMDEVALYNRILSPARIQRHAAGCSAVGCDYQAIPSIDGPVGYWRLGETSGTTAANISSLGIELDGEFVNGVTLGVAGLVTGDADAAASFDGTDDLVTIPSHLAINTGTTYPARTIELWFRANDLEGTQVLYEEGGGTAGFNIFLDGAELNVGAWASEAGVWVSTPVAASTTYHVALVFDGATQSVTGYLDGTPFGPDTTWFTEMSSHSAGIGIGSINEDTRYPSGPAVGATGDNFGGIIDEVVLYNSALAQDRIQAHALGCGTATCYALSLSRTGDGAVPVASPTSSSGCAENEYVAGAYILLTADADPGWEVSGWTGTENDASTEETNTVVMPASAHAASVAYAEACYALTLERTGEGSVPVASPANSAGCAPGEYSFDETITLSGADPAEGWEIGSWTGTDNDASTAATNTLDMPDGAHTAAVNYVQSCYPLTVGQTGSGTVPAAAPTNSTGCEVGEYVAGESITLSGAVPDTGWQISSWTGTNDNASTAATNTVTMPASAHAAAVNYTQICYPLTLERTGNGAVPVAVPANSAGCALGEYVYGASIGLTADPDTGWAVSAWTGTQNDTSTAETNTVIMPASAHTAGVTYYRVCYPLTLDRTGQGSAPVATPSNSTGCAAGEYYYGEFILLSDAIPATGWEISSWTGTDDDASSDDFNTVSMPASAHTVAVNYVRSCYPLTLERTGDGAVPVASPANSTGCVAGEYYYGQLIELTADPDVGWSVSGWTGTDDDASTEETNTLNMPANAHTAGVIYSEGCYPLTVSQTGNGLLPTTTPANSTGCPAGQYVYGTLILLSGADPDTGWQIDGWTGTDDDTSTEDFNTVTMPASAHEAAVNYTQICYPLTLERTGNGATPVAVPSSSAGCSAGEYYYGETIGLTADPDIGWAVSGWSGTENDASSEETNTVVMPAGAHTASVTYYRVCYPLTLERTGEGSVPVATPSNSTGCAPGEYYYDEAIALSGADPATGWEIDSWTGTDNDSSTADTNTLSMPASAHTAGVNYSRVCYPLTLSHMGEGNDPMASPNKSAGCAVGYYYYQEAIDLYDADPDTGWEISSWTGTDNDSSTADTNTLSMPDSAHTAAVNYTRVCYELTLERTGGGAVPVASPTNSTGCAVGEYYYGEAIDLSGANPDLGWEINSWTGTDDDGSTAATNTLTMPASDHTAAVNYTQICYALTFSNTGQGENPVATPSSSTGCAAGYYHYLETIDLTADPDPGWRVASWTGTDDDASTSETNVLTMPATAHAVIVHYEAIPQYTLTVTQSGYGSVTWDPAGDIHYEGTEVILTPTPDTDWFFAGWSGPDAGDVTDNGNGTWSLIMDADKEIRANFLFPIYLPIICSNAAP